MANFKDTVRKFLKNTMWTKILVLKHWHITRLNVQLHKPFFKHGDTVTKNLLTLKNTLNKNIINIYLECTKETAPFPPFPAFKYILFQSINDFPRKIMILKNDLKTTSNFLPFFTIESQFSLKLKIKTEQ